MPTYRFECSPCEGAFEIQRPMAESPGDTHPCPQCGLDSVRDWHNTMPLLLGGDRGEDYMLDPNKPALSLSGTSASYERQRDSEHVQHMRGQAAAAKRTRKSSRRKDGELRLVGSVPATLFTCAQRTSGDKHYWTRNPDETLRKHGLLFDS